MHKIVKRIYVNVGTGKILIDPTESPQNEYDDYNEKWILIQHVEHYDYGEDCPWIEVIIDNTSCFLYPRLD